MRAVGVLLVLALAGCATYEPRVLTHEFDPSAISWFDANGSNTLMGDALLRTVGGEPRTCAALTVKLLPDSPHATERLGHFFTNGDRGFYPVTELVNAENFKNADLRFYTRARTAVCDSQGRFRFDNLPDGSYWIIAPVTWRSNSSSWLTDGGQLGLKVNLQGGETKSVVLSSE